MVATYRSSDTDPKERFVHQQAGDGGYGDSSYIDIVALRERDANTAWITASDGTLEERLYYCQNQHADVVALVTSAGGQREMDRYSAYGVPFGLPVGNCLQLRRMQSILSSVLELHVGKGILDSNVVELERVDDGDGHGCQCSVEWPVRLSIARQHR
jgi:hypothetical protein